MINKEIVINHGDEYRVKIEKDFNKEDFFFDSYQKAAKCVNEIVNDALSYAETHEDNKKGYAFYDYGNNIIAFCAERGQGKTSAMLSFSSKLAQFGKKEYNNLLGFDFKKDGCFFDVLESIDPTMINNGVDILKIFLSRLFYRVQERIEERLDRGKDFELSGRYRDILACFKQCYTTIEYLQNDIKKEWNLDDLDNLSQISDSSNLKKSIDDLISLYFEIKHGRKKEKSFLVVQIDDADLAIGNASDICENVRKFLKIPGIIVLMATDYEQLKYVFIQKYHKEYEKLINDQPNFSEKCEKMASKYLEKILPHSRRIELPKLQNVIGEDHESLKVVYKVNGKDRFESEIDGCKDIQEQLIKLIYLRTGIILLKNEEKMHPFLPCRLRELTHLVKLLSEMEQVDHNTIFEMTEDNEEREKKIEVLQRNLRKFKSYFMRDWCVNRLKQSEYELIYKIDDIKINESGNGENDHQIYRILLEYIENDYNEKTIITEKKTHKDIINELIIGKLSDYPELQAALFLYYSIYLNIRFAYAFEKETEYQRIKEWLDYPIEVPQSVRNSKYGNKYQFLCFEFNFTKAKEISKDQEDGSTKRWFELFCKAKPGENFNAPEKLFISVKDNGKENVEFNEELKKAEFDFLQPLNAVFDKGFWQEWRKEVSKGVLQPEDSLGDVAPGKGENFINENTEIAAVHRVVKNIIANYDVQRYLLEFIEKEYRYINLKKNVMSWNSSCQDIYEELDSKYNQAFGFLNADSKLQIIWKKFFNFPKVCAFVFLNNDENKKEYINEYKNQLRKKIEEVQNAITSFTSYSLKEKPEEFVVDNVVVQKEAKSWPELDILPEKREAATMDNDIKDLWEKECKITDIYTSILNAIKKGTEEIEKEQKNIVEYGILLDEYKNFLNSLD